MNLRQKNSIRFGAVIFLAIVVGLISYPQAVSKVPPAYNALNKLKINLGLDLQGGMHLEYEADLNNIEDAKTDEAMQALQDMVERRVNAFGVTEPVIYTTKSGSDRRLVVELAGVKDIDEAKRMIGETPILEFKKEGELQEDDIPQELFDQLNEQVKNNAEDVLKRVLAGEDFAQLAEEFSEDPGSKDNGGEYDFVPKGSFVPEYETVIFDKNLKDGEIFPELVETEYGWHIIKRLEVRGEGEEQEFRSAHILFGKKSKPAPQMTYEETGLTGKNLKNAAVDFASQGISETQVSLKFDDEGTKLFAELTKENIGKSIAIYLDGEIISAPTVQSEITNGEAVITGDFTVDEARELVRRLNEGALPVPINLVSQDSVDASLGSVSLEKSLKAGALGLVLVMLFMIFYYRFLGLIASLALLIYTGLMISIFKLSGVIEDWQITLTLPGIAGFILSIGMAVDANILVFERTKEEIKRGRSVSGALSEGFKRAWTSIRDGNISSIITAFILIMLGTGFVKGFAVTLIIGVIISMFTALTISKTLLEFSMGEWIADRLWLLGISKKDVEK